MTVDISVPSEEQKSKKDRRRQSSSAVNINSNKSDKKNIDSKELNKGKLSASSFSNNPLSGKIDFVTSSSPIHSPSSTITSTLQFMSPMMTSSVPTGEHGGLLTLGHHAAHVRQFAHSLPQIGGHLSAFNHLHHLNLKAHGRSDSRSSSEGGEERPKSRNANSPPSSSPSSSPLSNNRMQSNTESKRTVDSDSEIEVDDDTEQRKRFKSRSNAKSNQSSATNMMSSSSFFINDILKNSTSPPNAADLQNVLLRTHPHLSPPSTPPNPHHPFSAQDLSLRASALHASAAAAAAAAHPNAYSLFAAAVAAAAAKPSQPPPPPLPTEPNNTANIQSQSTPAAPSSVPPPSATSGFFGPGQNLLLPHAAALNAIRPPFTMHGLSLEQMNAMMHHPPNSASVGADSDCDMDGDGLDDDICSSTEGDDERNPGQKGKQSLNVLHTHTVHTKNKSIPF